MGTAKNGDCSVTVFLRSIAVSSLPLFFGVLLVSSFLFMNDERRGRDVCSGEKEENIEGFVFSIHSK